MTDVTYTRLGADAAAGVMDQLCEVYADAYGEVSEEDTTVKSSAFRDRATSALSARNYELVTARVEAELVGFVFGYSLRQDRDWFAGLTPDPEPGFTDELGGERTVVLAEGRFQARTARCVLPRVRRVHPPAPLADRSSAPIDRRR
ncbi:hypothetical protein Cs7R123_12620 [Catellatospora sp. TT07R-123]|uniref:hypothetical protein n=1 Tax=Catellatospora sp. TT07R-123 TaxID=2733863 RepID=UPI001B04EE90|nr:hypothetical protein [Catellatospora sp. TT07R-123]GHJ43920.1 hypothetical protein Cs7R123_12620 [Catellatospora sp. TT07R-123]